MTAPNRFVFAAHQTNFATHHRFEKRHAAYYGARAAGGAGLIVLEGSVVHPSDWPYEYVIRGHDERVVDGYRMMADAVHRHGALVLAHLTHSGMQGSSHYSQLPLWAPSPVPEVSSREMPQEMEAPDIAAVIEGFAQSARYAADGGLDGVEINAGQCSLIRQFLSPLTNQRGDHYGGDLDNRMRFAREDLMDIQLLVAPEARRRHVTLEWDVDAMRPVAADTDALRQVLLNLLLNACKASPEHGRVGLAVAQEAGETRFAVSDSGEGMPEDVLAFVAQGRRTAPLVKGKDTGRGKGLGLWMVSRLVDDLGADPVRFLGTELDLDELLAEIPELFDLLRRLDAL